MELLFDQGCVRGVTRGTAQRQVTYRSDPASFLCKEEIESTMSDMAFCRQLPTNARYYPFTREGSIVTQGKVEDVVAMTDNVINLL